MTEGTKGYQPTPRAQVSGTTATGSTHGYGFTKNPVALSTPPVWNFDMPPERNDYTPLASAFTYLIDTAVRGSLERLEQDRTANGRNAGPGAFNRKDAATYIAVGVTTFDKLRTTKQIRHVDIEGAERFTRDELDRYLRKRPKKG